MKRLTSGQKWAIAVLAAIVLVVIGWNALLARAEERDQYADKNAFVCFSLAMQAEADPAVSSSSPRASWGLWPTLFLQVEYVAEFPAGTERKWAVIYIRPDSQATQERIDLLNEMLASDPGIKVDGRLTLPLTEEQVVSCPDAVFEIIKQLDRDQWNLFYPTETGMRTRASIIAQGAGIEIPGYSGKSMKS
jgi:hypothetical protein